MIEPADKCHLPKIKSKSNLLQMMSLSIVILLALSSNVFCSQEFNQVQDVGQKIKQLLDKNMDDNGTLNINKWFEENIQDPYFVPQINVSESGTLTSYKGNFRKMQLTGLKNFKIERIELNVGELDFNVTARIPSVQLSGQYKLKGKFTLFPLSGNGTFWMNFTDMVITCVTRFALRQGLIRVASVSLDATPEEIDLNFDDLFGGGAVSAISNSVLNTLSHAMFESIKSNTLPSMERRMRNRINDQLKKINMTRLQPTSNPLIDQWLDRTRSLIAEKGYDPYVLIEQPRNFSSDMVLFRVSGQVFDGTVNGLSTLMRTGPIKVIYINDSVILEMRVGFQKLQSQYNWTLVVGKSRRTGRVLMDINGISTFVRLVQPLKRGAKIDLESFSIENLGQLLLDVDGLGTGDYALEIIMNLAMNSFKSTISETLSTPMIYVMKDALGKAPITFI